MNNRRSLIRQIVERLDNQDLEHQHRIKRRSSAFSSVGIRQCLLQFQAKHFKTYSPGKRLELITKPFFNIKETRLLQLPSSPINSGEMESQRPLKNQWVFRTLHLQKSETFFRNGCQKIVDRIYDDFPCSLTQPVGGRNPQRKACVSHKTFTIHVSNTALSCEIMALRPLCRLKYAETAAAGPLDRDGAFVAIRQASLTSWARPARACCAALS